MIFNLLLLRTFNFIYKNLINFLKFIFFNYRFNKLKMKKKIIFLIFFLIVVY